MANNRINYVDFIKGAAIIAVVIGHINCEFGNSFFPFRNLFAYTWHVPVFFLVSGLFLKDVEPKNFFSFIKSKFIHLFLLALVFYIPAVLLHNYLCKIGWYSSDTFAIMNMPYTHTEMLKQLLLSFLGAGREPILGPMWFVFVLFFALVLYGIISIVVKKIRLAWGGIAIVFVLAVVSGILSNYCGLTINRCSNVFTALLLLYIGKYLYHSVKIKMDNGVIAFMSFVMLYEISLLSGGVAFTFNKYSDIATLIVGTISAFYVLGYVGQKIEGSLVERFVRVCGKESYYIMALHFIGFKVLAYFLIFIGVRNVEISALSPNVGHNVLLFMAYLFSGLSLPLLTIYIVRYSKRGCKSIKH